MEYGPTPNQRAASLRDVVDEVVGLFESRLLRQGIWVNVDVPDASFPADKKTMKLTVYQMVADAVEQMPEGGDLSISAFVDRHMIELEVADSAVTDRVRLSVSDAMDSLAMKCGGKIRWIHCAQGGTARVLQIPQRYQRAAA